MNIISLLYKISKCKSHWRPEPKYSSFSNSLFFLVPYCLCYGFIFWEGNVVAAFNEMMFANIRYAPDTPSGNSLNKLKPV